MTRHEMAQLMEVIFGELRNLREAGQKEYARLEENAFGNFERSGKSLNLDSKKILLVYAMKHLDGILAYIEGHKSQREDVRGRINDLIVYLMLLRGMVEEENPQR